MTFCFLSAGFFFNVRTVIRVQGCNSMQGIGQLAFPRSLEELASFVYLSTWESDGKSKIVNFISTEGRSLVWGSTFPIVKEELDIHVFILKGLGMSNTEFGEKRRINPRSWWWWKPFGGWVNLYIIKFGKRTAVWLTQLYTLQLISPRVGIRFCALHFE